jgi:hypothetical protein
MIWLVNLIGVRYSEAVVFVKHTIFFWKCFRQRDGKVIEG